MNITENIRRQGFYYDNSQSVSGGDTRRHYHDNFELYFLYQGTCNYFVDNRYYQLRAGDLIFIPSGLVHQTDYGKELHSRHLINCGGDYIPSEIIDELMSINCVFRNPDTVKEISEIFELIEKECATRGEYGEQLIKCHTHRLFYLIARHKSENVSAISENKTVENVIEYVKKHYMHEISLFEVAQMHAVSGEHLSRLFKKETGVGFSEFVNSIRLERAAFMLRHEEGKSVSEVAFACGFNDSNYFSYRFKKTFGVPPKSLKNLK
jgi:AraC-like DNA-binding protein